MAIPLLCILSGENSKSKRYMHPYAHNNTIYKSQDKEGNKMFTDRYMDKEDVMYVCVCIYIHTHTMEY